MTAGGAGAADDVRTLRALVGDGEGLLEAIRNGFGPNSPDSIRLPRRPCPSSAAGFRLSCLPAEIFVPSPGPTVESAFGFGDTARGLELLIGGFVVVSCSK